MPGAGEMFDAVYGKYDERCEILTGIPKPKRGIVNAGKVERNGCAINCYYKEIKELGEEQ